MHDWFLTARSSRVLWIFGTSFYIGSLWLISQYRPPVPLNASQPSLPSIAKLPKLPKVPHLLSPPTPKSSERINDVRNRTLGFEKVFVINLKDRTDKLDAIQLSASLTGFNLDVIEGVRGTEISNKSMPPNGVPDKEHWHEKGFNNIAGCWRSHINFAQRIVTQNLGSGLVIEDDADWSVYLKDQLEHVAAGGQYISGTPKGSVPHSPYGDDWDLIWTGHCGSTFSDKQTRRYVIENDATVPPPQHRSNNKAPDFESAGYDNTTRVVYTAGGGLCTQSYALSLRGARKILLHYSTRLGFAPIDLGLHQLCHEQILGFKCMAVFPQLWGSHRSAGYTNRDSDIARGGAGRGGFRDQAMTFNIVHSVRLNAERILVDGVEAVTSQWDDMPEIKEGIRTRFD